MDHRIAVTGIGLLTPVGCTPEEVLESLRLGRSGIRPVESFDTQSFIMKNAGEVTGFEAHKHFSPEQLVELDRATQMGLVAAQSAWKNSGLQSVNSARAGLLVGMSGAGQYQNIMYTRTRKMVEGPLAAFFHLRNLPHFQAATIAQQLQIHGPVLAFTSASGGSALAIGHAASLIRAGRIDIAVTGGSEAFVISSAVVMDTMQLCAPEFCSPFSGSPGMSLGEGAAFLILERYDHAMARGADILAELLGYAASNDAYDSVASDPSGRGIMRAMSAALRRSGVDSGTIQWIKASGCSTREQDLAETVAIKEVFADYGVYPPVSSLEASLGHANGASGAIGLAAAILCQRAQIIPPTLHFSTARPGCDLDYVPNLPRHRPVSCFIANTIAFGGGNVTLVASSPAVVRKARLCERATIAITGLGAVSSLGCGINPLLDALRQKHSGIGEIEGMDTNGLHVRRAGLVRMPAMMKVPGASLNRLPRILRIAVSAVAEALDDASLVNRVPPERIGLLVVLSRGPTAGQEQFYEAFCSYPRTPAIGRTILKMGRFYVTSTLAQCFQIRGYGATVSEGSTAGLHALIHAREMLSQFDDHDALIVIAVDELSVLPIRVSHDAGFLANYGQRLGERLCPYDPESQGTVLAEGAAAIVLERLVGNGHREAKTYAAISGCGLSNDAEGYMQLDAEGRQFGSAIDQALAEADLSANRVDLIYGHGRGIRLYDQREIRTLRSRFEDAPLSCVIGNLGLAESSCGLFSVAAAAMGMQNQEAYPVATEGHLDPSLAFVTDSCQQFLQSNVLIAGSTESGANAAVVLSRS
jgi:3-oxoacyl-[acyl-carrier-protein] synthase II